MLAVLLEVRSIPGGHRLSLGRPDARAADHDLPDDRLQSVESAVRGASGARGPMVPSDAAVSAREREAGALLAGLLDAGPVQAALHDALGEARGRGQPAVLVVDVTGPLRALPWELLGAPEPLEATGRAVVVRRTAGTPAPAREGGLSVAIATLEPDDPITRSRADALRAQLDRAGVPHGTPAELPAATVVHVVGHGDRDLEQTLFTTRDGTLGAATPVHALLPVLSGASLVVLDVCDAGSPLPEEAGTAPSRLLAAGARAVVAPAGRLGVEAAGAFSEGLYAALAGGSTLAEATAAGRRAVRALALPFPDGRWANLSLLVADVASALARLEAPGSSPAGWSVRGEARAWVMEATERARASGFFGVEHLLATWPSRGDPLVSLVAFHLAHQGGALERIGALQPRGSLPPDAPVTPRLAGTRLDAADATALARALWDGLDGTVQALLGLEEARAASTLETVATLEPGPAEPAERPPAGRLEVLGGPEDGLVVEGDRVGRAERADSEGLYRIASVVDPYLSRRALEREGGVWVARKALQCRRAGRWITVGPGPVELQVGDVLALSRATWVRGVP